MDNIIKFPQKIKNLRDTIQRGTITCEIRELLLKELDELEKNHPDSWDKKFAISMLTYSRQLSEEQIKHLERILTNPICEEIDYDRIDF